MFCSLFNCVRIFKHKGVFLKAVTTLNLKKMEAIKLLCLLVSCTVCLQPSNALSVDVSQLTAKIEDLMIKNLGVQFMKVCGGVKGRSHRLNILVY